MKLINKELNKRIHAILFFCKKVKHLNKLKIFKLLYFLDFIHFQQVGRPITDLEYYAFDKGPVPMRYYKETIGFAPSEKVDLTVFTKREQEILNDLAWAFKETRVEDMMESTYLTNEPWDKTKREGGLYKKIDFFLSLDENALIDKETARERYSDINETKKIFASE